MTGRPSATQSPTPPAAGCSHCSPTRTISAWRPGGQDYAHALAEQLAREVLRDAVAYHERFGMGFEYRGTRHRFAIDAQAYRRLLGSFSALAFDPDAALREGAFASYNQRHDRLNFRPENLDRAYTRPAMLHELVHAYQDLSEFRGLHLEIEATAYLAQALWQAADDAGQRGELRPHLERQTRLRGPSGSIPIFVEAARLCLSLGLDRQRRTLQRGDLGPLEQALRSSETYGDRVDLTFRGNGFRRD